MSQNTTPLDSEEELVRILSRPTLATMDQIYTAWWWAPDTDIMFDNRVALCKKHGWDYHEYMRKSWAMKNSTA